MKAGGLPIVELIMEGQAPAYFKHAKDAQLDWVSPTAMWAAENADVRIRLMAEENTRALSGVEPERQTRRQAAAKPLMETMMRRTRRGRVPLEPDAVPDARLRGRGRHVAGRLRGLLLPRLPVRPRRTRSARGASSPRRRAAWRSGSTGKEEIHIEGPGTDLTLNVAGRTFVAADGRHNMPDGEFFTGPGRGLRDRRTSRSPTRRSTAGARWPA